MPLHKAGGPDVDWLEFLVRKLGMGHRSLGDLIKIIRAAQRAVRDEERHIQEIAASVEEDLNG